MTDIQRWLLRARGINEKIDALDELIELTKARAEGSGSKGGGGGGSRKPGGFEKIIAQIETYERERSEMEKTRDEVYDAICMLSDQRWQTALIRYYITTQEWQDIADRIGVDRRTVTRWHGRALNELEKNIFGNVPECPTMSLNVPRAMNTIIASEFRAAGNQPFPRRKRDHGTPQTLLSQATQAP